MTFIVELYRIRVSLTGIFAISCRKRIHIHIQYVQNVASSIEVITYVQEEKRKKKKEKKQFCYLITFNATELFKYKSVPQVIYLFFFFSSSVCQRVIDWKHIDGIEGFRHPELNKSKWETKRSHKFDKFVPPRNM